MAMDLRFVDQIHSRLLVRYGVKWTRMWDGIDPEIVKADWAEVLGQLRPEELRRGLESLAPDSPPNAPQFRILCQRHSPEMYRPPALPDVPADPARVAAIISGLNMSFETIRQKADRCLANLRKLRDEKNASPAQLDFLQCAEANLSAPTVQQLGDFTPIPRSALPPGMRDDLADAVSS